MGAMATETRYKFHDFARRGKLDEIRKYIDKDREDKKIDQQIDQPNREDQTALLCAAGGGHYHVAKYLLEQGANTTVVDRAGWSALHHAAQNGDEATVELLLKGGDKYEKGIAISANLDSGA